MGHVSDHDGTRRTARSTMMGEEVEVEGLMKVRERCRTFSGVDLDEGWGEEFCEPEKDGSDAELGHSVEEERELSEGEEVS